MAEPVNNVRRLAVEVPAGTELLTEGRADASLVILLSGTLGVYRQGQRVAEIREPGAYTGERGALTGRPHSATIRAETTATVLRLSAAQAASLLRTPDAEAKVMAHLSDRLERTTNELIERRAEAAGLQLQLNRLTGEVRAAHDDLLAERFGESTLVAVLNRLHRALRDVGKAE